MTRVIIKNEPGRYDISLSGHAEKVNEGDGNRLCAAISMISQTFLQCILNEGTETNWRESPGHLRIICKHEGQISAYVKMLETGLILLEKEFPKNIFVVGDSVKQT